MPTETLYLSTFLSYSGQMRWAENLYFDFNNTVGIPLNTSLPAFDQHFQSAEYSFHQGLRWDEYFMSLAVSYDATDVGLAEDHTDEICREFQRAFNLNISVVDRSHSVNNETSYVTTYRKLGYMYLPEIMPVETLGELVKYKPDSGFGQFITRDFLSLYSDISKAGIINLEYSLKRVDQTTLSWRFVMGFRPSFGIILGDQAYVDVNFNKMLNRSGPISPLVQGSSRILVDIMKKETTPEGTYSMTLEHTSPNCTSEEESENSILIAYNLSGPIDNVTARIKIVKEQPFFNWVWVAVIVAVVTACLITVLVFVKIRRKKLQEVKKGSVSNTASAHIKANFVVW